METLVTKKSNCKNCYKCIRHCPVKSLKFTDGQAHIIRNECILCGECYVVCPQNAKQIRDDLDTAKNLVKNDDVFVSLAPSFAAWYDGFNFNDLKEALLKLGFKSVEETALGATVVKKQYEEIIKAGEKKVVISSCCPSVNTLIKKHFTDSISLLAEVVTPMEAHTKMIKEMHKNAKVVFIGPCISKKTEAEHFQSADCVLTFEELDGWFEEMGIQLKHRETEEFKGRTRIFPTSGGILQSMDKTENYNYVVVDGTDMCIQTLQDISDGKIENCFIEMSACKGSCINGPVLRKKKHNPVKDLLAIKNFSGENDYKINTENIEYKKTFGFEGVPKIIPDEDAIKDILVKMGKNSPEQELNCGSCGYNTCREKAEAVFRGKADLTMCLPFLKEKAENFSDKIISNSPNGIIVLDDKLNVQQINKAALNILKISNNDDVLGNPVVRILDPVDYVVALSECTNSYDKRKYLAEYQKYIDETVIYDKEYGIIVVIMKDVSTEEKIRLSKEDQCRSAVEITDRVVEKQMRVVQEIASLLGETTAETKIALTKLKETLSDE